MDYNHGNLSLLIRETKSLSENEKTSLMFQIKNQDETFKKLMFAVFLSEKLIKEKIDKWDYDKETINDERDKLEKKIYDSIK